MAGRRDAGRPMDVKSDVPLAAEAPLASVQSHPDADRRPLGPLLRS